MKGQPTFHPRQYQLKILDAIDRGYKRVFALHHRRAGKDLTCWHLIVKKALEKKGLYYYFLPTFTQAKRIIWEGITNEGERFLDFIPREVIANKNETEMKLELVTGSIVQLIGTDYYDRIRGTNPVGCVFSEFAFQNPMAWEVVKPILKVNRGWVVFVTTPNGKNHAYEVFQIAQSSPYWFSERLTIKDTGLLNEEDMNMERAEGMSEEMISQEYYCDFSVGTLGAYYVKQLIEAESEGRFCGIPIEKLTPVDVFMDLGRTDSTAIGFRQIVGKEWRIIDAHEENGQDVSHYCKLLKDKGYNYRYLYLPHDAFAKRMESRYTIAEQFQEAGFTIKRVPMIAIENGIQQVRRVFPRLWFDKDRCKYLLKALENYHREWDEQAKVFKKTPLHDWSSHSCFCRHTKIFTSEGEKNIIDVSKGDYVLTPIGWSKVLEKQKNGERHVIDFLSTKSTQDHPVLTQGGFRPLKELLPTDSLLSVYTIEASSIRDTLSRKGLAIVDIFNLARRRMEAKGICIEKHGQTKMGLFRRGTRFTIKITTLTTTILRIFSYCLVPNTLNFIGRKIGIKSLSWQWRVLKLQESLQINGMVPQKEESGIQKWQKKHGKVGIPTKKFARDVLMNIGHIPLNGLSSAVSTAKCQCSDSVEVYNLKTDTGMYIANGVVVSNCDMMRYMSISELIEPDKKSYDIAVRDFIGEQPKYLIPNAMTLQEARTQQREFQREMDNFVSS